MSTILVLFNEETRDMVFYR